MKRVLMSTRNLTTIEVSEHGTTQDCHLCGRQLTPFRRKLTTEELEEREEAGKKLTTHYNVRSGRHCKGGFRDNQQQQRQEEERQEHAERMARRPDYAVVPLRQVHTGRSWLHHRDYNAALNMMAMLERAVRL